jgi:hypothetical protein
MNADRPIFGPDPHSTILIDPLSALTGKDISQEFFAIVEREAGPIPSFVIASKNGTNS